jgi:hypothetical protein
MERTEEKMVSGKKKPWHLGSEEEFHPIEKYSTNV